MKRNINSITHATADYLMGVMVAAAPWIVLYYNDYTATRISVVYAALILVMTFFTRFEGGFVRIIPYKVHLAIDMIAGIAFILLPWLLGLSSAATWTMSILGLIAVMTTMASEKRAYKGFEEPYYKPQTPEGDTLITKHN
ncbi:hypothetical protein SAMN05444266_10533 [Chitinophaga jiangningensis]|uniref:SPW repeat-containing integral membrane domain-containing protein n=1 Tax=Chitinophaga jiangningensis TaxID=1419482 RepID=A0A1M7DKN0_9BACT|nr:hypothetical protein [Chitinophaga jiangningensis]SHL80025.1 hypothetical protein SAMN05444266_10533 [Chitinophaga jiangningensis]